MAADQWLIAGVNFAINFKEFLMDEVLFEGHGPLLVGPHVLEDVLEHLILEVDLVILENHNALVEALEQGAVHVFDFFYHLDFWMHLVNLLKGLNFHISDWDTRVKDDEAGHNFQSWGIHDVEYLAFFNVKAIGSMYEASNLQNQK